ncbi:alpha/beta-hydrolase [Thelephora ganbajun]|uniref:Alpha/beta-hydrolase n=1 Tax=Thelephora ganbajun TaxID=370292 RepID=A0ACB6ZL58_THEGA|nr:alpha/beta-hydrolase [Thelephora ganbajun]
MVARCSTLPPFLRKIDPSAAGNGVYTEAIFAHSDGLGSAHSIWWHPAVPLAESTVILFVPGNPGLAAFYTEYLSELHSRSPDLAILAHSHLAHTPKVVDQPVFTNPSSVGLPAQLKSVIEALDAIKQTLQPKNIVLVGHSMGGWLCLQILKARPEEVSGAFLLFPSLCNMAVTPNGRKLSYFFRPPIPLTAALFSPLLRILPNFVYKAIYRNWPAPQLSVLRDLLRSPTAIYACLTLADEEMKTITALDEGLINEHQHKLWLYFAEHDDWVGDSKEEIIRMFHPDHEAVRVVRGEADIPHAFCINHGKSVAQQSLIWLQEGGFL